MRSFKLVYFDGQGRAETVRLLFALAGTAFEDYRFPYHKWEEVKPSTPFGMVPVLEVDGESLSDSGAICRYLAKEFGFMGKTPMEAAKIDMIMCIVNDTADIAIKWIFEHDKAAKALHMENFKTKAYPKFVSFMEKQLGKNDFLVGDKVSVADVWVYQCVVGFSTAVLKDEAQQCEKIAALVKRVEAIPQIAKHLSKRTPDTIPDFSS